MTTLTLILTETHDAYVTLRKIRFLCNLAVSGSRADPGLGKMRVCGSANVRKS